jgi:hypothetical protein
MASGDAEMSQAQIFERFRRFEGGRVKTTSFMDAIQPAETTNR